MHINAVDRKCLFWSPLTDNIENIFIFLKKFIRYYYVTLHTYLSYFLKNIFCGLMITKIIMLTATSKVNTIYVMQSIIYTYIFMHVRIVLGVKNLDAKAYVHNC